MVISMFLAVPRRIAQERVPTSQTQIARLHTRPHGINPPWSESGAQILHSLDHAFGSHAQFSHYLPAGPAQTESINTDHLAV